MALPKFLQPYLASYDLSRLNLDEDKDVIITQILNLGDEKAVRWLFENYLIGDIKKVVENPTRGMWTRRSLSYWQKILDARIHKFSFELAIINLDPGSKIHEKFFEKLDVLPKGFK